MRTTGVRCAPVPAPRPKQPQSPPKPLPRTRFLQKTTSEKPPDKPPDASPKAPPDAPPKARPEAPPKPPPKNGTLTIISQSIGPPKTRTPPPKPPRSPSIKDSPPSANAPPSPRRPGLMEVLSRPSPSPPASPSHPQPARAAPQAPQAPQGRGGGRGSVPTRPAPRPRPPPLSLPPPPTSVAPRPPPGSAPPRLPLRPSPTQIAASRARGGAPEPRPGTPRATQAPQSPVCSVEDFESSCQEVFRNTRHAKELAARGKHVQAASHYQVALTALDRVLRAQVLNLTNHEATRQRLFLLQQDVFNLRKEALNGFTDAQTAVRAPRGLSPTRPTPGAPPSYEDVLDEDRRRRRDHPRGTSRQAPPSQPSASAAPTVSTSTSSQRPPLRPHPKPNPTHVPPPAARTRPQSTIETLVDALEPSTASSRVTPSIASSASHGRAPRKPSRSSAARPKSSYHPPSQSIQPMSLPLPLTPISVPLSPPPSLPALPDEVLQSQVKALQVFESAKNCEELPSVNDVSGSLQEGKKKAQAQEGVANEGISSVTILGDIAAEVEAGGRRGEKEKEGLEAREGRGREGKEIEKNQDSTASASSADDPFLSLDPLSSVYSQARREGEGVSGGGGKDQAKRTIATSSASSIDDPFLSLDPFPPVESKEQGCDVVFSEGSPASSTLPSTATDTQHTHSLAFSNDFTALNEEEKNSKETQDTHSLAFSDDFTALNTELNKSRETQLTHSPAFSDDFTALNAEQKHRGTEQQPNNLGDNLADDSKSSNAKQNGRGTQQQQQPDNHLGDSILEALDFATTPTQGHRRVSPQSSRGRSYSEENLLDSSHNTLEALLNPNRDVYASRASIIEEFDPLMSVHDVQAEAEAQSEVEKAADQREVKQSSMPTPAPRKTVHGDIQRPNEEEEEYEGSEYGSSPPGYYAEVGAVALPEPAEADDLDYPDYPRKRHPDFRFSYAGERLTSCSSDDSGSVTSWQNDLIPGQAYTLPPTSAATSSFSSYTPVAPIYPSLYPQKEEEEEEDGEKGVDVGRSAFYLPPSEQGDSSRRRDLLRIREGVKIYFIHTDGVITSPWKRPFLSVCKDPARAQLAGEGLMLSVGNNLWACQLSKKATLVLRTQSGGYVFSEVAGKPECKAVCVRVPSSIRRPQQEFLSKILEQNTLLEEERPKGFTKAISKGASSAATRVNKLVENSSMSPTQPFVRRNSMRALKGVSKRLNTIAEKTGATMKELPKEYQPLQEAADTLAFARNAKMIQYI